MGTVIAVILACSVLSAVVVVGLIFLYQQYQLSEYNKELCCTWAYQFICHDPRNMEEGLTGEEVQLAIKHAYEGRQLHVMLTLKETCDMLNRMVKEGYLRKRQYRVDMRGCPVRSYFTSRGGNAPPPPPTRRKSFREPRLLFV